MFKSNMTDRSRPPLCEEGSQLLLPDRAEFTSALEVLPAMDLPDNKHRLLRLNAECHGQCCRISWQIGWC